MAQDKTRHSDFERGRNAVIDDARETIQKMKDSTDGLQRDDWQLGYAAACREIGSLLRQMRT